jgi:CRP/FNR family transcriptional regulator
MSINVLPVFEAYPIFNRISPRLQGCVRSELRHIRAEHGQVFFRVGDGCSEWPLIVAGTVRVIKPLPTGRTLPLYTVGPGEFCALSMSCLIGDLPYPAEGRASGEVVGATLPKTVFQQILDDDAAFRKEIFGAFATRFAVLMGVIEEMSRMRLDERLADLLVSRGPVIHATHQALADELGTAREVVSRILEHFEADGLVNLRRGHVEVLNGPQLNETYVLRQVVGVRSRALDA